MKEIQITEIENMKIGNAQNEQAGTGCTVLLFEKGAPAGLDVRGGGPASRESELLKPMAAAGDPNPVRPDEILRNQQQHVHDFTSNNGKVTGKRRPAQMVCRPSETGWNRHLTV